ncbi:MAG: VanW family protein [bacterium]
MTTSRRDVLKLIGAVGAFKIAAEINKYALLTTTPESKEPIVNKSENPLGIFIDRDYPFVAWTLANVVIARRLLDGLVFQPGESLGIVDKLFPDGTCDPDNVDPKKGFVVGKSFDQPWAKFPASGICKASTDIFRAALYGPMVVEQSSTHYSMHHNNPLFTNFPYGTDDSIYIDPPSNTKIDLVIHNPWKFPITLQYKLFGKDGQPLDEEAVMNHPLDDVDMGMGLWQKYIEVLQQVEVPIKDGYFPTKFADRRVSTAIRFWPMTDKSTVPEWRSKVDVLPNEDGQIRINRILEIDGEVADNFTRTSSYNPIM